MEKREVDTNTIAYPMPCTLVGATVDGKPNFLTVAYFSVVKKTKPVYVMISLGKTHYTNRGIKENDAFSVNIPSSALAEVADYCGIVSGKKYDKGNIFEIFYGKIKAAPMIKECPYNFECTVVQKVDLGSTEVFIGEVVAAYSDERYLTEGIPALLKMAPFVLSMGEKKYIGLGTEVGPAWEMGRKRIPKDG